MRTLATRFKMFPKILPPFCVLRFLYRLSPNCYVLVIVTFLGNLFLLTLSNLARKIVHLVMSLVVALHVVSEKFIV